MMEPKCAGCFMLSENFEVCKSCASWLPLKNIYITSNYDGINEVLLKEFKFSYKRQNAVAIAKMMAKSTDKISGFVLCPIPTAPSRIRMRGFDHAKLIAKRLSKETGLHTDYVLKRKSNARQLGSSRKQRIEHMQNEFYVKKGLDGQKVIIVDDVMTSGATLAAASRILKEAGASEVRAVIFARQVG